MFTITVGVVNNLRKNISTFVYDTIGLVTSFLSNYSGILLFLTVDAIVGARTSIQKLVSKRNLVSIGLVTSSIKNVLKIANTSVKIVVNKFKTFYKYVVNYIITTISG
jgi:hypothetical protein